MDYDKLFNPRVVGIPPSGIRKFFDIVAEMKEAISLGVGEPDFVSPPSVCAAALKAIEEGETHYTSNWGMTLLRREIATYLQSRYALTYDPANEIIITVGASEGIDLAMRTVIAPGDEVLVPDPAFVSYAPGVFMAGGVPVTIPCHEENDFRLMAEDVKRAITPKTKALVLPFPNNPTGAVMDKADLQAVADVLSDTDILVMSDEIYSELGYDGYQHTSFATLPGMWDRTITLNGFSKAFAMTGFRVGYVCAHKKIAEQMLKIHQYIIMSAPTIGQCAAIEALRNGMATDFADVKYMVDRYDVRRKMLLAGFHEMGLPCFNPRGAFYTFPNITSTGLTSEEFATRLLQEYQVAVVPGNAFGESGQGFIRCCYATADEKIEEAIRRMGKFVQGLKK